MAEINAREQIATERLTPGGLAGPDAMDWALRGALVLLAGAAVWFVVAIVRPMPTGGEPTTPPIPALTAIPEHAASIDDRQRRLSSLNAGGNIFAGDRRNWPIEIAADDGPGETIELTTVRGNPDAMTPIEVGSTDIDQIELAVNVSAAIRKRLEQLKLRGVFAIGDRKTAMIGQKTNTASEAYREGDTFDDGEWRVVAIDVERDRVILSRSGQNFELKLYDTGAVAAAPRASINATNTPGEVEIGFTSLDKVAGELRDAGMPREQINELIALAQEQPGEDAAPAEEAADPEAKKVAIPPAMPPGMVQLFKAMAEGSRDVIAPTTPGAPAPSDESAPKEESDDDDG